MKDTSFKFATMHLLIGRELGTSEWLRVDQERIGQFADATCDHDWLHTDPERAAREGPYGGTIAFGFWTLSMLTYFSHEVGLWPEDAAFGLNYGLDRVRWIRPIRIGARIRNRISLVDAVFKAPDRCLVTTLNTVEIEGEGEPALTAEWLGMFVRRAT